MTKETVGESILDKIGNTPLIKIEKLTQGLKNVEIYAKAEWLNPGGSVKDRPALRIIETAEKKGKLTKNKSGNQPRGNHPPIILDSSSGNMAIAYGMIGAIKGYRVEMILPENASEERKKVLRTYGVKLTFTNPAEGTDGAIRYVHQLYEKNPDKYFFADQYNNKANPLAHYKTTGKEIIKQTKGRITHFVVGIGTSGTIMGAGKRLKEFNPNIKLIAVEPEHALHGIEGLKYMGSAIVPSIYNENFLDAKIPIKTEDAYEYARKLALVEGLLVGESSGAAIWASIHLAKQLEEKGEKAVIVTVFPDRGDRYFSTPLWCPIEEVVRGW
ncbi:MAG TPA: cysteine synthase [Elusimicrobia bacterium]|jgi:cysteine synthase B|nr:cysteine synthase [Elusimicrobiota bacterium]